ncbi:hypothetical protein HAZT_HAZT004030 [Hyalella azteca]|uniref:Uncharacterized protein n=1 Tax=Hyalella azteca TaxID=294128 RepID=A0A6A0HE21_HYAAZ|nr:hypothetical protein HAZT_HAZT004030 [Hyalella azteca]
MDLSPPPPAMSGNVGLQPTPPAMSVDMDLPSPSLPPPYPLTPENLGMANGPRPPPPPPPPMLNGSAPPPPPMPDSDLSTDAVSFKVASATLKPEPKKTHHEDSDPRSDLRKVLRDGKVPIVIYLGLHSDLLKATRDGEAPRVICSMPHETVKHPE